MLTLECVIQGVVPPKNLSVASVNTVVEVSLWGMPGQCDLVACLLTAHKSSGLIGCGLTCVT